MNYALFDGKVRKALLPFTFTRPVAEIRIGILTIREKWEHYLQSVTGTLTEPYLSEKYPLNSTGETIFIDASFLPTSHLAEIVSGLRKNQAVFYGETLVAFFNEDARLPAAIEGCKQVFYEGELMRIEHTWDIFTKNGVALQADFELLTHGRESEPISPTNRVIAPGQIFIEKGAVVEHATLNASTGPIYIGRNAEVMEGGLVRGAFALCEGAQVKMGAKIYGPTTVGPYCKAGGEITNSVLFGYSNKGHEGFLGNSVIGEWCNLGADTNVSNLKNNYEPVRLWSYETENFAQTGLQFCGLMMGDHSKCGINTMFNTGTVIGVSANIFGSGFPRNFIPSFSWGGAAGFSVYKPEKVFETAQAVFSRRNKAFTEEEAAILRHIFEETRRYRRG